MQSWLFGSWGAWGRANIADIALGIAGGKLKWAFVAAGSKAQDQQ
ncbi:MAG: hypothetical protein RBS35_10220 [Azonexus sp.]|jgi:hypothetical protein|nr:hypothetical protein [Azonexus sp.]